MNLNDMFEKLERNDKGYAVKRTIWETADFTIRTDGPNDEPAISVVNSLGHPESLENLEPVSAMGVGIALVKAALELQPELMEGSVIVNPALEQQAVGG